MRLMAAAVLVVLMVVLVASAVTASSIDASRVRSELREVLSRPEYNRAFGPDLVQRFWGRLWEWLTDLRAWFGRLFSFGGRTAGKIASIVFASLVIAAFAALVVFVGRRLSTLPGRIRAGDDGVVGAGYDLPSAGPLMARAAALAEAGDYRAAFRCAYLASISHLDETGALRFERSRTNWEYIRELNRGGHAEAHDALRPLTLDFDRRIYGREQCTRADYERALAAFSLISAPRAAA